MAEHTITTITVSPETRDRIAAKGAKDESFEKLLTRLCDEFDAHDEEIKKLQRKLHAIQERCR